MNCERCNAKLQGSGRYFPGSGYPVQIKREYAHVCVICETKLLYGPLEERDAVSIPVHECNDCGILIQDHLEICSLCERWYEDHGIPLPKPAKPANADDARDQVTA